MRRQRLPARPDLAKMDVIRDTGIVHDGWALFWYPAKRVYLRLPLFDGNAARRDDLAEHFYRKDSRKVTESVTPVNEEG